MIEVRQSTIHGRGVFATQRLFKGRLLGYYTGKRLRKSQLPTYKAGSPTYYWLLDSGLYIDGNSDLRFVNHSCAPNVRATEVRVNNRTEVEFRVLRQIPPGAELLLDYSLQAADDDNNPYECLCGAESCRGTMLALA